jgi:Ca-activated chloride channel family protein
MLRRAPVLLAVLLLMLSACASKKAVSDEAPLEVAPETAAAYAPADMDSSMRMAYPPDGERYARIEQNRVTRVVDQPVSTFSVDVDTGSYSNVRRMLNAGYLPPADAVRAEEFINYFDYDYAPPTQREAPFAVHTELAPAPWAPNRHLLLVGLKGYELPSEALPPANLVFLIDTSGSMMPADKLPLLIDAFKQLVPKLRPQDRVSIVVYAGSARSCSSRRRAIASASFGGAESAGGGRFANGGAGIDLAYARARLVSTAASIA